MPEMHFRLRWPDGAESQCYSPSLVIEEHLRAGVDYDVADFLARCRTALSIASERVRARYGFPCARALGQLAAIERQATAFIDRTDARVRVVGFDRPASP